MQVEIIGLKENQEEPSRWIIQQAPTPMILVANTYKWALGPWEVHLLSLPGLRQMSFVQTHG